MRWLLFLKIPCSLYSGGECFSEFLRWFFVTHLEDREDVVITFSRGFEQVDVLVKFGVSRGGGEVLGRLHGGCFGNVNILRVIGGRQTGVRGAAGGGVVAGLSAMEAATFSDALGSFGGGELR